MLKACSSGLVWSVLFSQVLEERHLKQGHTLKNLNFNGKL
jgi:hypothetical protein